MKQGNHFNEFLRKSGFKGLMELPVPESKATGHAGVEERMKILEANLLPDQAEPDPAADEGGA